MKKIFTLLVSVGLLTAAANAQSGTRDQRDQQYGQRNSPQTGQRDNQQTDRRYDQQPGQWDRNSTYDNQRVVNSHDGRYSDDDRNFRNDGPGNIQWRIAQINRKYDMQVERVQRNFFMRRGEKIRMIRSLEMQRQQEIRMLYARSGNNRGWQQDRGYESNHRY